MTKRRPFRVSSHAEDRVRERLGFTAPAELWERFVEVIDGKRCPSHEVRNGCWLYLVPVTDPEAPELELHLPIVFCPRSREVVTVYDLKDGSEGRAGRMSRGSEPA